MILCNVVKKFRYELTLDEILAIQTVQETVAGSNAGKLHCSSISIDSNSIPNEMNGTYTRLLCMKTEMQMCNGHKSKILMNVWLFPLQMKQPHAMWVAETENLGGGWGEGVGHVTPVPLLFLHQCIVTLKYVFCL